MAIIPSIYKNAVVCIGFRNANGMIAWIGTGFFVVRSVDENAAMPFLVSNKHVFNASKQIVIRMKELGKDNWKEADANLFDTNDQPLFTPHPNQNIDIAVLPLSGEYIVQNNLEFPAFNIDNNALSSEELRENGVEEGSTIYMLGFPLGLVPKLSSHPICRLGCIARISEDQIKEQSNILIDIQNFPGNSGSPIINRPELFSIEGTKCLNKSVLVGIIHSYIPYTEQLRSTQTNEIVEIRRENSGLAYAHPVEFIRDVIDIIYPQTDKTTAQNEGHEES